MTERAGDAAVSCEGTAEALQLWPREGGQRRSRGCTTQQRLSSCTHAERQGIRRRRGCQARMRRGRLAFGHAESAQTSLRASHSLAHRLRSLGQAGSRAPLYWRSLRCVSRSNVERGARSYTRQQDEISSTVSPDSNASEASDDSLSRRRLRFSRRGKALSDTRSLSSRCQPSKTSSVSHLQAASASSGWSVGMLHGESALAGSEALTAAFELAAMDRMSHVSEAQPAFWISAAVPVSVSIRSRHTPPISSMSARSGLGVERASSGRASPTDARRPTQQHASARWEPSVQSQLSTITASTSGGRRAIIISFRGRPF